MEFIPAKTLMTKNKKPEFWFGHDYNVNIYRGCSHRCIYCDSRSECYRVEDFDRVRAKENALTLLQKELRKKDNMQVIGTGAMSDPYNPLESKYLLTRGALEIIQKSGHGVSIATKSSLITRDIDILREMNKRAPVCTKITITTYEDELSQKIEPCVDVSSKRFAAIKEMSEQGIFTGVLLLPVLPFITDTEENILGIVKKAYKSGAKFVYPYFGVTLRQNQRDYYFEQLDKLFPGMKNEYIKYYGNSYDCKSLNANSLKKVFQEACRDYGMLYQMKDIIKVYKDSRISQQISLFE